MKVVEKGEGGPELVVVGSVHGDEPAGKKAIEKLLEKDPEFLKPVKFIVANEKALKKSSRYLEADLNSSFPGDPKSSLHEERLAAEITEHVKGETVLDLHTTISTSQEFTSVKDLEEGTKELISSTGVENSVCFPEESGVLIEMASPGVLLETGPQGSDKAARRSFEVLKNFLACQGFIHGECVESDPDFFQHFETVKGDWKFEAENFRKVEKGDVYATREDEELVAQEDFYPVLMSTNGYRGKLGYKAEKIS